MWMKISKNVKSQSNSLPSFIQTQQEKFFPQNCWNNYKWAYKSLYFNSAVCEAKINQLFRKREVIWILKSQRNKLLDKFNSSKFTQAI